MRIDAWFVLLCARFDNWCATRVARKGTAFFETALARDPEDAEAKELAWKFRRLLINCKVQRNAIDAALRGV